MSDESRAPAPHIPAAPTLRGIDPLIPLLILAGLLLRAWCAGYKGLVLDEFHSDFHASRSSLTALLQSVRADNHPPLSFFLISLAQRVFGEGDWALRVPALIASTLEFGFVWLLARPYGRTAARVAVALVVFSSLHLDQGSMARMYAPLAACLTGATWASLRLVQEPSRSASWIGGICVGFALGLHYFALHYLLWLGLATLALACRSGQRAAFLRRISWPLGVALLANLPWYMSGLREQLGHGLPPGGDDLSLLGLLEAYAHLFFLNLRLGGTLGRGLFLLASCGILGFAGLGLLRVRRLGASGVAGDHALVLGTMAWMVPLWTFLVALAVPRSGFTWHYILPSVAPMAVLAASGLRNRASRWGMGGCVLAALILCVLNCASRGTEDYPGAVELIETRWQSGDAVVCVEFQPPCFPSGRPWDRYAEKGARAREPRLETEGIHLVDPTALDSYKRVWLIASALPESVDLRQQLDAYGEIRSTWTFGWRPIVTLFERRTP